VTALELKVRLFRETFLSGEDRIEIWSDVPAAFRAARSVDFRRPFIRDRRSGRRRTNSSKRDERTIAPIFVVSREACLWFAPGPDIVLPVGKFGLTAR